ncbi:hypothetical protein JOE53_001243 [Microbacterium laevaniformans]|uniref:hypothetical protein n=1 Tax=Microbacterium laevaniformans TaxID=36807 RepID=UPI001DDE0119|nr:hypothetical protein [Microbacterium laevaniformans]MBM7752523.1 hypothetical protein [Microbacterium laevaniformans]
MSGVCVQPGQAALFRLLREGVPNDERPSRIDTGVDEKWVSVKDMEQPSFLLDVLASVGRTKSGAELDLPEWP